MKVKTFIRAFALFALFAIATQTACTDSVLPDFASVENAADEGKIIEETELGETPRGDVEERASGITGQKTGQSYFEIGGNFNCKNRYKYYNSYLANSEMSYTYEKAKGRVYAIESGYEGMTIVDTLHDALTTNNRVRFKIACDARVKYVVPNSFQVRFKFSPSQEVVTKSVSIVPTLLIPNMPNDIFFGTQKYHLLTGRYISELTGEPYGVTLARIEATGVAITPAWTPAKGTLIRFGAYKLGIITEAILQTAAPNVGKWTLIVVEYNAKCNALKTTKEYKNIFTSGFKTLKSADGTSLATTYIQ
jgi:hypothetical protein